MDKRKRVHASEQACRCVPSVWWSVRSVGCAEERLQNHRPPPVKPGPLRMEADDRSPETHRPTPLLRDRRGKKNPTTNLFRTQALTSTGRTEPSYSRFTTATVAVSMPFSCWVKGRQEGGRAEARAGRGAQFNRISLVVLCEYTDPNKY